MQYVISAFSRFADNRSDDAIYRGSTTLVRKRNGAHDSAPLPCRGRIRQPHAAGQRSTSIACTAWSGLCGTTHCCGTRAIAFRLRGRSMDRARRGLTSAAATRCQGPYATQSISTLQSTILRDCPRARRADVARVARSEVHHGNRLARPARSPCCMGSARHRASTRPPCGN